jgi:hypothetical protein
MANHRFPVTTNHLLGGKSVFELADGKIRRFDCYPEGSVILTQLGVIGNLDAAFEQ